MKYSQKPFWRHGLTVARTIINAWRKLFLPKIAREIFQVSCLYQLVYGRLPNLPNTLTNKLPAQESQTSSAVLQMLLETLHKARQSYVQAESLERVRREPKQNVRNYEKPFTIGKTVFYQRPNKFWRGPCKVVGIEGPIVLVKRGGETIKVHKWRVRANPNHQLNLKNEIDGVTEPAGTDYPMKTNETNIANNLKGNRLVCQGLRALL